MAAPQETAHAILRLKELSAAALVLQDKILAAYVRDSPQLETLCKDLNDNIASLLLFKGKIEALIYLDSAGGAAAAAAAARSA
jgi:hypothetical protein